MAKITSVNVSRDGQWLLVNTDGKTIDKETKKVEIARPLVFEHTKELEKEWKELIGFEIETYRL